jgi:glycosyltransferase involved in cell wall biosynthesis
MRMVGEHDPFVRIAARRTALALAATPKTAKRLLVLGCARVEMEACVGMTAGDCEAIAQLPAAKAAGCFRAISIGNLLCWKGFDLGIAAFAQLASKRPQAEYWILGDGPERLRLEAMAARLGIKNSVRFFARVSRQEVLSRLAQCDVLIHPSSHDSGFWVSLEAMAAARR